MTRWQLLLLEGLRVTFRCCEVYLTCMRTDFLRLRILCFLIFSLHTEARTGNNK